MRVYVDDTMGHQLQDIEVMLTALGLTVPKFDSALFSGVPDDPRFVALYSDLKCVAAYGRGFGCAKLRPVIGLPDDAPHHNRAFLVKRAKDDVQLEYVANGTHVRTPYGNDYRITGIERPHHEGSSGRVHLKAIKDAHTTSLFPHVFDMMIVDAEE